MSPNYVLFGIAFLYIYTAGGGVVRKLSVFRVGYSLLKG